MSVAANEIVAGSFNPVEERCDRCGARGYVKVTKKDLMLIFCNHHGREYGGVLIMNNWLVKTLEMV